MKTIPAFLLMGFLHIISSMTLSCCIIVRSAPRFLTFSRNCSISRFSNGVSLLCWRTWRNYNFKNVTRMSMRWAMEKHRVKRERRPLYRSQSRSACCLVCQAPGSHRFVIYMNCILTFLTLWSYVLSHLHHEQLINMTWDGEKRQCVFDFDASCYYYSRDAQIQKSHTRRRTYMKGKFITG